MTGGTSYVEAWNEFGRATDIWVAKLQLLRGSLAADTTHGPHVLSIQSRRYAQAADRAFKVVRKKWHDFNTSIGQ
jgi:hypothetical protein